MWSYESANCDPPAPVASVKLRHSQNGAMVEDVLLLLDTGADVTLLPRSAAEKLGVQLLPDQKYELMGFDGSRSFAPVVALDLIFLNRAFRGRYLLIDESQGIMGRDVLNHVSLVLDGPRLEWSEHVPHPGR
jgi:predicted aspartyl protease